MNEQIWKYIAELSTPGFFVTADIMYEGEEFPVDIKAFIIDKLALIETGISARKFTFHSGGWRIHLTFFPTDRVVDNSAIYFQICSFMFFYFIERNI